MRTLHRYLTRQVVASLLMTVAVFTFVLLLGNVLKEILALLVNRQATLGIVTQAIGLLVPFVWVFALPMGMLTATLLIFGRLSADQELTAIRASGISLLSVTSPILLLSVLLCAVSALVNMEIAPRCRVAYTSLILNLRVDLSSAQLPEATFIKDFKNYIFYVGKNRRGNLQDVMVFRLKSDGTISETLRAPTGKLEVDSENKQILLHLAQAKTMSSEGWTGSGDLTLPLSYEPKQKSSDQKVSDMTFTQLWQQFRELQQLKMSPSLKGLTPEQLRALKVDLQKRKKDLASPVVFHIHRQIAFSFACFGFTLVGIPLGIRVHRRETNIGFLVALILVAIYYSFVLVGYSLERRPEWAPHLIVWLPNFLFQAVGAVLMHRANRGI